MLVVQTIAIDLFNLFPTHMVPIDIFLLNPHAHGTNHRY